MRLNEIMLFWRKPIYTKEHLKLMKEHNLTQHNIYYINNEPALRRINSMLDYLSQCMTSMVTRFMYDVNLPFKKLVIEIWDDEIDDGIKVITGCLGVQEVRIIYSPWKFFTVDDLEKKKITIDIVEQAALVFCSEGFSFGEDFKNACRLVRMANYENRWLWKRKQSKNKLTAEVVVLHDIREIHIWLSVYNHCGQMLRRVLVHKQNANSNWLKMYYLGNLSWKDDIVSITSKEGFLFSLDTVTYGIQKADENRPPSIDIYFDPV